MLFFLLFSPPKATSDLVADGLLDGLCELCLACRSALDLLRKLVDTVEYVGHTNSALK